jgi:hypothetical protein
MSVATWLRKFYPSAPPVLMPKIAAIKHSLRKWIGLRPANLKAHGLAGPPIRIHGTTCSLCCRYYDSGELSCAACPLYVALGNHRCDEYKSSPYRIYHQHDDPEPMIKALKKTLKEARNESSKPAKRRKSSRPAPR